MPGHHGTLVAFLLDALNVVSGNLDREGGAVFGTGAIDVDRMLSRNPSAAYGATRSRVGGLPSVVGQLPASLMAKEMTTPGKGQLRAFFVSAGNPVSSVPNGDELEAALPRLDLMVAIDIYLTETSRHADYVLPATTFLEREDFPLGFLPYHITPFVQWTEAVVRPLGEARQEWHIIDEISRRIGVTPSSVALLRHLGRVGLRVSPELTIDLALRLGPDGDLFGLRRGGLSLKKLRRRPHGIVLRERQPVGVLRNKVFHADKRVRLDPDEIVAEVAALEAEDPPDRTFPLRLIGLRELRSHNSWMHNVPKLMQGDRVHAVRVHPEDARSHGIGDGDRCRVSSPHGRIELIARVTDEMTAGTVAVPHGWGHRGGWRRATAAGGANVNLLASSAPEDLERLGGMALLNGISVRLERLTPAAP